MNDLLLVGCLLLHVAAYVELVGTKVHMPLVPGFQLAEQPAGLSHQPVAFQQSCCLLLFTAAGSHESCCSA